MRDGAGQARGGIGRGVLAVLLAVCLGSGVAAQQVPPPEGSQGQVRSPVLTVDADRLFSDSLFGKRVVAELGQVTEALAAENRRIEADLTEEERRLTQQRPNMDVAEFRAAADSFDARVQEIRQQQDAKERALNQVVSQGRDAFLNVATPVLGQLMIDRGAVVILDRRTVFLGVGIVDVTDPAIAAIDAEIGDGADLVPDLPGLSSATSDAEPDTESDAGPDAGPDAATDVAPD